MTSVHTRVASNSRIARLAMLARGVRSASFLKVVFCGLLSLAVLGCHRNAPQSDRAVATRFLAEYLARTAQPKGVLVVSNPFTQQPGRPAEIYAFEKAGVAGLTDGFREKVPLKVVFPRLKEEVLRDPASVQVDPRTTTPLSFLVADDAFSELIRANADCDLVVSLIGLPLKTSAMKEWTQPGPPRFALVLPDWRMIGGRDEILRAFQQQKLLAAVVNKPNAAEQKARSDHETFESRFLLVTPENVEPLIQQHPALFGLN